MSISNKTRKSTSHNSRYYIRYIDTPIEQCKTPDSILIFTETANKLESNINLLLDYYKKVN